MSRSTVCVRTEEHDGPRWSWGHLYAQRVQDAKGQTRIVGGSHGNSPNHITETAQMMPEHANVLSDLLRAAYANNGGQSCGGKTMLELFWEELMTVYERLMTGQEAEEDVGIAQGIAYCIAVAQNPYLPSIDAVREQAAERWAAQEAEPPPKPARASRRRRKAGR